MKQALTKSVEFGEADTLLHRKPDWLLAGEPVYTTMRLTREGISSRGCVRLRAPHRLPELHGLRGLDDDSVEKRLALMANMLQEYGSDLLWGDFKQLGAQRATR
jgi:hypothetical protein